MKKLYNRNKELEIYHRERLKHNTTNDNVGAQDSELLRLDDFKQREE